ncbi:MAG: sodium:solute symporter [Sedimentisphaeraceae bacterium JB056]
MHLIDWLIVASIFIALAMIGIKTQRYVKGVSGFLAADRCAGRYLLTLADGMAALGAIGFVATFQQYYESGFPASYWGRMQAIVMMFVSISGFVIYRYRQTRAMTMAQFMEMRYSRRFRIFAGILSYIAGVVNYGIFPAITARFLIYFCDLPVYIFKVGPLTLNATLGVVMAILLVVALTITFKGGQIAIMVTDFFQAQYVNVVFLILLVVLVYKFGISDVVEVLKQAPEDQSKLNPFAQGGVKDFNMWFFVLAAFNQVYSWKAWQGNQGYNCSARTPHEAKMASVLGMWRYGATWAVLALIPIFAYYFMHNPLFASQADIVKASIDSLQEAGADKQLLVPFILKQMLPVGCLGLFVGAIIAAAISTDDTCLHSWGSILVQDVIMPLRKEPLDKETHMKWLRRSIIGVAVFVWFWSMLFPLQEYIFMYFAITGSIYVGGGGAVIIGGLYWKRGTTAGAWGAMITGMLFSVVGLLVLNIFWPFMLPNIKASYPNTTWLQNLPEEFWLNGMEMFCYSAFCAIFVYIVVSLLTKTKEGFSMDKMLHRGKYAIEGEKQIVSREKKSWFAKLSCVDDEYSKFDRFVAYGIVIWNFFWFGLFIIVTIYALKFSPGEDFWGKYWVFDTSVWAIVGSVTVFWFLWGGFKDLKELFKTLNQVREDDNDDGRVEN